MAWYDHETKQRDERNSSDGSQGLTVWRSKQHNKNTDYIQEV